MEAEADASIYAADRQSEVGEISPGTGLHIQTGPAEREVGPGIECLNGRLDLEIKLSLILSCTFSF